MRTRWRNEADGWRNEGSKITSSEKLETIRETLQERGPIIVEHWFYRGGSAPHVLAFGDFDEFMAYLEDRAYAGDIIDVWSFVDVCRHDNRLVEGKCPDESGQVPERGAY